MEVVMRSDVTRDPHEVSRRRRARDLVVVEFGRGWAMMKENESRLE